MQEIHAPQPIPELNIPILFLAGSIEMGHVEDWQDRVTDMLQDEEVLILNPRRDAWDNSWKQSIDNPLFKEQVMWELNALEQSTFIIMYFDPNTKSPISLLELGLYARTGKMLVVCPPGFWRKGNVDVVCEHYHIPQFASLEEVVGEVKKRIKSKTHYSKNS